jgi:hypothetical protein
MGTPYTVDLRLTGVQANTPVAIDFPGRVILTSLAVVEEDGVGTPVITLYGRAFTSDALNIVDIADDGNGVCRIRTTVALNETLQVGDTITVAGTTGYDGSHLITAVLDNQTIVTSTVFVLGENSAGTVTLAIPAAQQVLYVVAPPLTLVAGAGQVFFDPQVPYANMDPRGRLGFKRKIYINASTVSADPSESESESGAAGGTLHVVLTGYMEVAE